MIKLPGSSFPIFSSGSSIQSTENHSCHSSILIFKCWPMECPGSLTLQASDFSISRSWNFHMDALNKSITKHSLITLLLTLSLAIPVTFKLLHWVWKYAFYTKKLWNALKAFVQSRVRWESSFMHQISYIQAHSLLWYFNKTWTIASSQTCAVFLSRNELTYIPLWSAEPAILRAIRISIKTPTKTWHWIQQKLDKIAACIL